jgi:hypothetical protein
MLAAFSSNKAISSDTWYILLCFFNFLCCCWCCHVVIFSPLIHTHNIRWMGEKYDGVRCCWNKKNIYPRNNFFLFYPLSYFKYNNHIIFLFIFLTSLFLFCNKYSRSGKLQPLLSTLAHHLPKNISIDGELLYVLLFSLTFFYINIFMAVLEEGIL